MIQAPRKKFPFSAQNIESDLMENSDITSNVYQTDQNDDRLVQRTFIPATGGDYEIIVYISRHQFSRTYRYVAIY